MIHALATGAGKDATLAFHRARAEGLDVSWAFNVYEGTTGRVRFHGTPKELVVAHARALELELVTDHTHPREFEEVFLDVLERLKERGVGGVVFGNVHLDGVRAWYEERTRAVGLEHVEPLWGEEPSELVRELIALGYRATVVSVDLERGDPTWLGRELTLSLVDEIEAAGVDPCGEHGEYHTFVWDGPDFHRPLPIRTGEVVEMEGHRLVDLSLEETPEK